MTQNSTANKKPDQIPPHSLQKGKYAKLAHFCAVEIKVKLIDV